MKTCSKCGETKPLEEFQVRSSNKDGRTTICKVCKRLYDNTYYKDNPDRRNYIRSNSDARRERVRLWVFEYLSDKFCVDCGESDIIVLEFDHREDKEYDIATMMQNCGVDSLKKEIAKCDIRCANCHRRKTAAEFGWWKTLMLP